MHRLTRQVRFSINPLCAVADDDVGSANEGLSIFLEAGVEIAGEVDSATGFIVNVTEIEEKVRSYVVPALTEQVGKEFRRGRRIGFIELTELLKSGWENLADKFGQAKLSRLELMLNPFRKLALDSGDFDMVYYSEKFEFAATHKLWNNDFSFERNFEVFGKCANPSGHGHNYSVEVTVKVPAQKESFHIGSFANVVEEALIKHLDHKNLNADVAYFSKEIPTVENIATFAWDNLVGKFGQAQLHCVTVKETEQTSCSYYG